MTSLFLSYARGDDEPFARRLYADLTAAGFDVWFDRVSMPSRSLTFHQEIRDAIASCDRLIPIVGPKAKVSQYVQQEWQFAYFWDAEGAASVEKIVVPVLRLGEIEDIPDELKLLHCEDFRDDSQYDFHLKKLIQQLFEPAPPLGKLIAVPSLPPHFLSRSDRLTALRDALRVDLDRPVVITGAAARVGVHGMGGIGKSVIAAMLSRDRKIREAFPDGIVWIGLGTHPSVAELHRRVHKDLGGDGAFQNEHEGRVKLRDILKDKAVLLILDDVWRREDVDWFDVLGPRCRAMITTRDSSLLKSIGAGKGVHHRVELLTDAEALTLLGQAAGVERHKMSSEATDLIAECGRLPLALALCGGLIRDGFTWARVLEQLRTSRIDRIRDPNAAKFEHENIWNAIDVSVKFLSPDEQARFLELAVYSPDEATPIAALQTLWSHTAGFDDWDTDALINKLSQRSLMELTPSADGKAISLHDLVYDYVRRAVGDETTLHRRLLEAYRRKCPDGWHVNPPNDGYFFTHLRHHLVVAGRASEMADLLHELHWLEAKNEAELTFDLTADFDAAMRAISETDIRQRNLRLLDEALRRDIHFIARHAQDYPQGLFQCLWNTCWLHDCPEAASHYEPPEEGSVNVLPPWEQPGPLLSTLLERWRTNKEHACLGFRWLRSLRPPAIHLGTAQKAIMCGHEGAVRKVAFSPDGLSVVSDGADATVRFWDAASGAELRCLRGRRGIVAISLDGRRVVSAESGYSKSALIVMDAESGTVLSCLYGHSSVVGAEFSPDGCRVVSASGDETVRIWDAENGSELLCHRGDAKRVASVGFSADGSRVVIGAWDSLRVLDAESGAELRRLRAFRDSVSATFSPDGSRIVSGSGESVGVWDVESGAELYRRYYEKGVNSVAFSPDGRRIVSGSEDKTVRVWDATSGTELRHLRGQKSEVRKLAFSPDNRRVASLAWEEVNAGWGMITTVHVSVWDSTSGIELLCFLGHEGDMTGNFVNSLDFSPDGRLLRLVYSFNGRHEKDEVLVWETSTGAFLGATRGKIDVSESDNAVPQLWRAVVNPLETVIVAKTGDAIAWFPTSFHEIANPPSGRTWAGRVLNYLCIFTLEGSIAGESQPAS